MPPECLGPLADIKTTARRKEEDHRWALGAAVVYGEALEERMAVMGEEGRAMGELVAAREAEGRRKDASAVQEQWDTAAARLRESEGWERTVIGEVERDLRAGLDGFSVTFRPLGDELTWLFRWFRWLFRPLIARPLFYSCNDACGMVRPQKFR